MTDRPRIDVLPAARDPDDSVATFSIGVLGSLSVRCGEQEIEIRRGLPRIVLSSLVLDRGRPVAADTLIDRLWGEALPRHPANALQTQMAYLRRVLGGSARAPIATGPNGYRLDGVAVDVAVFEAAIARGRRLAAGSDEAAGVGALATYDEALTVWRGSPYGDVAGAGFADAEIVRLEELCAAAADERCELLLALGRVAEAVAALSSLVNAQPLREDRQRLLVLALYRAGRQADALRAYERARLTLAEELGVEPGRALRGIEQQVLVQDPALDWLPKPTALSVTPPDVIRVASTIDAPSPAARSSTLIGRERELARLHDLVARHRLVTLTGPGGAGKTRLALEVAADHGPSTVVDLGAIDEAARVGTLIALACGASVSADDDPVDVVVGAVGVQPRLLVLDTCEHVLDGVSGAVERLLERCPNLRVLATSRRPLGVVEELAWPVPPLAVPTAEGDPTRAPAFELFVERARAVDADFEVTPGAVASIAELCRALDGLPLAIELAAAQMDVLSPAAVRTQLGESRSLVNRAGGPERHRTLHATTAWSVGLLGDDERDLLYRLAVFAPPFDIDAVVAVAGGGDPTSVDRFVTLVRNSLVAPRGDDRYRLLDTVRAFLVASETDAARRAETERRHAEYYADLAARSFRHVRGPDQAVWLRRLHGDRPNLRLALRWCFGAGGDERLGARLAGDIAWVWTLQGNMLESRAALERALRVDVAPLVRARLLLGVGLLAAPLGDQARVIEVCTESAELGRSVGDDETVAVALLTLGVAQWATGDLEAAAAAHDDAIRRFATTGDEWSLTICRVLRARTARDAGDLAYAEQLLEVAIDDAKQTGDDHVIGLAYEQFARLRLALGEHDRAASAAAISLRHNEALSYAEGVVAALTVSAEVEHARGAFARARDLVERAVGLAGDIGHVGAMAAAVEVLAAVEAADGRPAAAARYLVIADRARRRHDLPLAPAARERVAAELDRLRDVLGAEWSEIEAEAPMTSLAELARSIAP